VNDSFFIIAVYSCCFLDTIDFDSLFAAAVLKGCPLAHGITN